MRAKSLFTLIPTQHPRWQPLFLCILRAHVCVLRSVHSSVLPQKLEEITSIIGKKGATSFWKEIINHIQ